MKNDVCAEVLPAIDPVNLKIMHKLKIVILAFAVLGSGMLIALLCSNKADESSWASPLQDLGSLADTLSVTEEPTIPSGDDLEHFLEGLIFNELQYGAAVPTLPTQQMPLPNACLSGLKGIDLANVSDPEAAAQLRRVKALIASNALKATPSPTGSFKPKRTRSLPAASAVVTRQAARGPQGLIASEWATGNAPSAVRAVNFENYNPHARVSESKTDITHQQSDLAAEADCMDPHAEVFRESEFPSATKCASCHEQIYQEWASSGHAYASISPMFQKFEQHINDLTQGTIGYFCLRCHAPVATTVGLRRDQAIWDGPRVFREGVTCIACHRVKENYTKTNGERRIEPGDEFAPIYSSQGGLGPQIAAQQADYYKVKVDPNDARPGQPMHRRAIKFEQLSQSDYCMSCHQVAVQPGIKLEVVWDQYRASPAHRKGVQCQECHMGAVPGRAEGYTVGPAAIVNQKVIDPHRKHANHMFYGPGYSIAHPGLFPQNIQADRWTVNEWLMFDWRAGWGTERFEEALAEGNITPSFPAAWQAPDDRYDAREIIDENQRQLAYKRDLTRQVLENGSKVDGPFFREEPAAGKPLRFHYCVQNTNPGHNMPSGSLGAQPQLWLNVVLIGPDGNRLWESGYLDSVGDLADLHSQDVLERRVPLDKQLFNLQTKFLTTNVKGTDREMYLPINVDVDQLPFIRPAPQPVSVLNHPPFIRMEAHSIPPLGSRKAKYVIPAPLICLPGTYRLSVRMRSRPEPIYFMQAVDSTAEMMRLMNEGIVDTHVQSVIFDVH